MVHSLPYIPCMSILPISYFSFGTATLTGQLKILMCVRLGFCPVIHSSDVTPLFARVGDWLQRYVIVFTAIVSSVEYLHMVLKAM